jgi:hypothetical protein
MTASVRAILCGTVALVFASAATSSINAQGPLNDVQIPYYTGQNVVPVFEGWERNPDGSYDFIFGYLNRNYEEVLDVPVGPGNNIQPGGPDRGQPTHFYPRRTRKIFKVTVPKDWRLQDKLVWTLTVRGRTEVANGWLQPEWEVGQSEESTTALGEHNAAPVFLDGDSESHTISGRTIDLTVTATDDGIPKPRKVPADVTDPDRPGVTAGGVTVRWVQFRGPTRVEFSAAASKLVYGQPVSLKTTATFSQPGDYVLLAVAGDGQLTSQKRVMVSVKP